MENIKDLFDTMLEDECKQMRADFDLVITSLTKEDLKKLVCADTKEAYDLLFRIIRANEAALGELLGVPFESEAFKRIKVFVNSVRKYKPINIILSIIGKIIKITASICLFGIKLCINCLFALLLAVIRFLKKMCYLGKDTIAKIVHICNSEEYDDLNTNVSEVIDHLNRDYAI